MSSQDYFHEKAEESRHNEVLGYIMFLAGSVFFVGGILTALAISPQPNWFIFIPYVAGSMQALYLELAFLVIGFVLIGAGIASGLYFSRDRSMYMTELFKARDAESLVRDFRARTAPEKRSKKS